MKHRVTMHCLLLSIGLFTFGYRDEASELSIDDWQVIIVNNLYKWRWTTGDGEEAFHIMIYRLVVAVVVKSFCNYPCFFVVIK